MASLALLFALRLPPAPFLIMDEVDAALDSVNVAKLAAFVKRRASSLQIVAVSLKDQFYTRRTLLVGVAKDARNGGVGAVHAGLGCLRLETGGCHKGPSTKQANPLPQSAVRITPAAIPRGKGVGVGGAGSESWPAVRTLLPKGRHRLVHRVVGGVVRKGRRLRGGCLRGVG